MSNALISLMLAAGAGTWIFAKLQRKSGNNTQQSAIASGIAAIFIFFVTLMVLSVINR